MSRGVKESEGGMEDECVGGVRGVSQSDWLKD